MAILNQIRAFVDQRGLKPYRFWKQTGLSRATAYRLYSDRSYVPTGDVLDKICQTYRIQPGELLIWVPDEEESSQ